MNIFKGFYVYVENPCPDPGRSNMHTLGWYRGEPDKETLTKIAKSYVKQGVIPFEESQLTVYDDRIFAKNAHMQTLY